MPDTDDESHASTLVGLGFNDPSTFESDQQSCSQSDDGFKDGRPGCTHLNYNREGLSYYDAKGWNELMITHHLNDTAQSWCGCNGAKDEYKTTIFGDYWSWNFPNNYAADRQFGPPTDPQFVASTLPLLAYT